jgi:hypothetical protein
MNKRTINKRSQRGGGEGVFAGMGCLTIIGLLLLQIWLGADCLVSCLWSYMVDTWLAGLAGLPLAAQNAPIPVAIICFLLNACGIHTPYLH